MDYIVFHDSKVHKMRYYWVGAENGYLSPLVDNAKRYKSWEAAQAACKRIKRWRCKFMSWEDYQEWLEEGRKEVNLKTD